MAKFTPVLSQALSRAISAYNAGKLVEAEQICQQIININPDLFDALHLLAAAQSGLGKKEMALVNYDRALKVRPHSAEVLSNRGVTLHELKRFKEALASYDRALKVRPDYAEALSNRGHTLSQVGELDSALVHYRRALALKPNLTNLHVNIGNALKELGQLPEAQKAYLDAIRLDPGNTLAYLNFVDSALFLPGDPHLAAMEALAAKIERLSKTDRVWLHFALGKAYADLKDYRRSFEHLLKGNAAKRAMISYDEKSALAFFDRIEAVFTPELMKAKSGGGEPSPRPIFVIGMPRSGTTLIEQIIASHPMVHGAGELQTLNDVILAAHGPDGNKIPFPECVPAFDASALQQIGARYVESIRKLAPSSERVTDKMLQNYYLAGLIHLALPNAKIIHTIRNPVDTCVSCFARLYSAELSYTCDLGELGRYYKRYQGLMAHWRRVLPQNRILDVRYEEVVADLEGQARRIIAHCGLSWDKRCLSFHETIRPVKTASATQVRQPIYQTAVGRWRVYEEQLGPLLSALGIVTSVEE